MNLADNIIKSSRSVSMQLRHNYIRIDRASQSCLSWESSFRRKTTVYSDPINWLSRCDLTWNPSSSSKSFVTLPHLTSPHFTALPFWVIMWDTRFLYFQNSMSKYCRTYLDTGMENEILKQKINFKNHLQVRAAKRKQIRQSFNF